MRDRDQAGFTLLELMIVIAIIGILASIAAPKFADVLRRSKEGATKGNLGALRTAVHIYYADLEGVFPADTDVLTVNGRYLSRIPEARTPGYHGDSAAVLLSSAWDDSGGWTYQGTPGSSRYGEVFVNCTHTDSKGSVWTSY